MWSGKSFFLGRAFSSKKDENVGKREANQGKHEVERGEKNEEKKEKKEKELRKKFERFGVFAHLSRLINRSIDHLFNQSSRLFNNSIIR